ncbi:hypothetical protein NDU88_002705 [Pleurodeles waltl]|uniref:Uncharacterized protein n=1 Tax=Pleurodeles waltl TaxID=8319 RepID=A0AAV7P921_PLEWA|nr:hypothetical protein NDU88_002705 [Pleurodeles waltl]
MEASPPPSPATVEQEEASMGEEEQNRPTNLEEGEPETSQKCKPASEKQQTIVAKTTVPTPEIRQEPNQPCERREMFQRLRPQLAPFKNNHDGWGFQLYPRKWWPMWDQGWGRMNDAVNLLGEMVGEASLTDVIGSMGPDARNFTWSHPDGSVRSRIDFVLTSKSVRIRQHSMVTMHFSDHRAIRFQGELTGKVLTGPGTWKLNSSLLGREDVQEELRGMVGVGERQDAGLL